jgi:predicted DNA-binding protein (MmcQ/YjbR family)
VTRDLLTGRSPSRQPTLRTIVTAEELRAWCLAQAGADETFPFSEGVSVFKVRGRMFALSRLSAEPLSVSVKCDPDLAVELRAANPAIQPGYHLNKRHWITIALDGSVEGDLLDDLVDGSYDLVVAKLPKRTRDALASDV